MNTVHFGRAQKHSIDCNRCSNNRTTVYDSKEFLNPKAQLTVFALLPQVGLNFLEEIRRDVLLVHGGVQIENLHDLRRGELIAHFDYRGNIVLGLFGLQQFGRLRDRVQLIDHLVAVRYLMLTAPLLQHGQVESNLHGLCGCGERRTALINKNKIS